MYPERRFPAVSFNTLDAVLAVIIGISVFSAVRNGFTREVLRIGFMILAFLVASWFNSLVGSMLEEWIPSPRVAAMVGFLGLFLGLVIVGAIAARALAELWKLVGLGWLDMLLGGVFGLIRGVLGCAVLVYMLLVFRPFASGPQWVGGSAIAPWVLAVSQTAAAVAPEAMRNAFQSGIDAMQSEPEGDGQAPADTKEDATAELRGALRGL